MLIGTRRFSRKRRLENEGLLPEEICLTVCYGRAKWEVRMIFDWKVQISVCIGSSKSVMIRRHLVKSN